MVFYPSEELSAIFIELKIVVCKLLQFWRVERDVLPRFNPFPNKPWFLCVCCTSVLKTLGEKEKLLITSNLSFSPSVFYMFREVYSQFAQSHFAQNFPVSPFFFSPFPTWPFSHSAQYLSCPFAQFHFCPEAIFPISPFSHKAPSHFTHMPFFRYLGPKLMNSSLINQFLNFGPYF